MTMFEIPRRTPTFHFCIPLGYPRGSFGPNRRKPIAETIYTDRWGAASPARAVIPAP